MSKQRVLVEPTAIVKGDVITRFRPYNPDERGSNLKVETVERRRGCTGTHVNGSLCVTVAVEVERNV